MSRVGLTIMVAHPNDAGTPEDSASPVGAFFAAAATWNRDNPNSPVFLDPREWHGDAVPLLSQVVGQQETERQLFDRAQVLVAIFNQQLGQPCQIGGQLFESGTAREIAAAQAAGKPTHVWACADQLPPAAQAAQVAERARLDDYLASLSGLTGSYASAADLADKLPRFFEQSLHDGQAWAPLLPTQPIIVDSLVRSLELPNAYIHRSEEQQIADLWEQGCRRVALVGDGGVGKSLLARAIRKNCLEAEADRPYLMVFVEPASVEAVRAAFADAATRLGIKAAPGLAGGPGEKRWLARELVSQLTTADWDWLIVLDNADPVTAETGQMTGASIFEQLRAENLLPPDSSHGRILITTRVNSPALASYATPVTLDVFTAQTALDYLMLRGGLLAATEQAELAQLAEAVGYLPLALSIAASTIESAGVSVAEWIRQFEQADTLEHPTVNEADPDGYPLKLAQTWSVARSVLATQEAVPGLAGRAALLCAVLDSDENPGWLGHTENPGQLWQTEAVKTYLAGGGELPDSLGRPRCLRDLRQFSLINLRSMRADGTWPDELISMHRLTARAIQASFPVEEVDRAVCVAADGLTDCKMYFHADRIYRQLAERYLTRYGEDSLERLDVLTREADAVKNACDYKTAIKIYEYILPRWEERVRRGVRNFSRLISVQYQYGLVLFLKCDYPKAKDCFARLIDKPIPRSCQLLARYYYASCADLLGQHEEAAQLFATLTGDFEGTRGPTDYWTLETVDSWAYSLKEAGEYVEAAEHYHELAGRRAAAFGEQQADTLKAQEAEEECWRLAGRIV